MGNENGDGPNGAVWKVLGPILLSVTLIGGGGWLTYVQAQLAAVKYSIDRAEQASSELRERLRGVEVQADAIQRSIDDIQGDAREAKFNSRRIREQLDEYFGAKKHGGR